jgi:HK97 family phage major capsid protein
MNKLEILDAINGKKDEMRAIIDAGEAEQRKLTENEENDFKRLEEEIRGLKLELRKEENNELKANKKMEKRFSVLEAINDVINGRKHNEDVQAYLDETRAMAANAGLGMNGQIQIDTRAVGVVNAQTSTGEGVETVATEKWDLLTALRDKSAIVKAGAQVYSNLVGDVDIPIMGRETVTFAGELDMVSGAPASFTSVSLKPQRVTCTVPVSKTWLRQNSPAVEAQLKNSIIDAINEKVEREILGDSAAHFDGLMVSADTASAVTYEDIVNMETEIEGNNMTTVFICDAKAKGQLKLIPRQEGSTIAVWNEGQIDDMPTYVTNAIKSTNGTKGNIVAVDASQVVIGYWGDVLDIVVDPYSRSRENIVNIVVTTYVDAAVVREDAYKGLAITE